MTAFGGKESDPLLIALSGAANLELPLFCHWARELKILSWMFEQPSARP